MEFLSVSGKSRVDFLRNIHNIADMEQVVAKKVRMHSVSLDLTWLMTRSSLSSGSGTSFFSLLAPSGSFTESLLCPSGK